MDEPIERVEKALGAYAQADRDSYLRAARSLLAGVSGCLKYVRKNPEKDKECAQKVAKRLDELIEPVPGIGGIALGKEAVHRLHTRRLAEEHLEMIEQHLQRLVKVAEEDKSKVIEGWVEAHPIFGELRKSMSGTVPENTYVLLFEEGEDGALKLVTESAKDGRIFTRFRPGEFAHSVKLHKNFAHGKPVVGAAVIADKEIASIVGKVPEPQGNKDQLRTLLSLSSAAAGQPAVQFMELNSVLKDLHDMARRHKLSRDMYVLLFQSDTPVEPKHEELSEEAHEEAAPPDEAPPDEARPDEAPPDEGTGDTDEGAAPPEEGTGDTDEEREPDHVSEGDTDEEQAEETPPSEEESVVESVMVAEDESTEESEVGEVGEGHETDLEIVTRATDDGKILSRFWASDFMIRHKLFEQFKTKKPIVGAAVIEQKKSHGRAQSRPRLVKTIGVVPQPHEGKDQLSALLGVSSSAVQKPFAEFVEQHDVLKHLHELAKGEMAAKDPDVIIFVMGEAGRLEVMPFAEGSGHPRSRTSLVNFAGLKDVYDQFHGKAEIVGASIITKSRKEKERPQRGSYRKGQSEGGKKQSAVETRRPVETEERPVVLAAFGRTPLRANLIATPEILNRLGIRF